jgi:serine protease Do
MSNHTKSRKIISNTLIISILIFIITVVVISQNRTDNVYATVTAGADRPLHTLADLNQAYIDISNQVRPTVVTVSTDRVMTVQSMPFGNDPFLDFFFGQHQGSGSNNPEQREYHQKGLGSGIILTKDGIIITNNHVIDGADSIYVRTYAGKRYTAKVVGVDAKTDIAVLRIKADDLPYIPVGNSDNLQVGEIVLAVGSPMSENFAFTVTQGIVSAKGRSNVGLADYEDFIQTDAAINPGNSGGPLVNLDGKLIGINTAIASQSGGFQGIGFAVPSNMAMQVMNSLVKEGRVVRGWLGVSIQDIDDAIASAMNLKTTTGALVSDVVPDGPAAKAGLQAGDIITRVNNQIVNNSSELRSLIASTAPKTNVDLTIVRNGSEETVSVTLGELPKEIAEMSSPDELDQLLGFHVSNLTGNLARQLGINMSEPGVVVTSIDQSTNAYMSGLRQGDLIYAVNKSKVDNVADFDKAISKLKKGDSVLLRIKRNDASFFLAFQL